MPGVPDNFLLSNERGLDNLKTSTRYNPPPSARSFLKLIKMSIQEQYFRKALFNILSESEAQAFAEARKNPDYEKTFREYLDTSTAILEIEEKAARGQEQELAYRYAEENTNAGEDLYVAFRMHHDEEFAALVAEAHAAVAFYKSDPSNTDKEKITTEVTAESEEKSTRIRRLPQQNSRWMGIAAAVLLVLFAGWWVIGGEGRTIKGIDGLAENFSPFQPPKASEMGALGAGDSLTESKNLLLDARRLLENQEYDDFTSLMTETVLKRDETMQEIDYLVVRNIIQLAASQDLTNSKLRSITLKLVGAHEDLWIAKNEESIKRESDGEDIMNKQGASFTLTKLFIRSYASDNRKEVVAELSALIEEGNLDENDLSIAKGLLTILD